MVRTLAAQVLSKYPHLWEEDTAVRFTTGKNVFPHIPSFAVLSNSCTSDDHTRMSKKLLVQCIHLLCHLGARTVPITDFFRALFDRRTIAWRLIKIPIACHAKLCRIFHLSPNQVSDKTKLGTFVDSVVRRQRTSITPVPGISYTDRIQFLKWLDRKDLVFILRNLRIRRQTV